MLNTEKEKPVENDDVSLKKRDLSVPSHEVRASGAGLMVGGEGNWRTVKAGGSDNPTSGSGKKYLRRYL